MKKLAVLIVLVFATSAFSQVDVSAGMGINFTNAPKLNDYINFNVANSSEQIGSFNANVEFFAEADMNAGSNYQAGIGYGYTIYSYNSSQSKLAKYDLYINTHAPTLFAYYVIPGEGYKFRLGGGIGYRYALLQEKFSNFDIKYKAQGVGLMLKADGNTSLGGDLYALIGFVLKWDLPGKPEHSTELPSGFKTNIEEVSLNSFSAGVRLGLSYFF